MNLTEAQRKPQRVVNDYPVVHPALEVLLLGAIEGHNGWCRDPKLVASIVLHRVAPRVANSEYELASFPSERTTAHATKLIYSFSALDGRTIYRVTLRRYGWLLPIAGSTEQMVWPPVHIETISRSATD